jgi:uncharacterized membrane protein
VTAGPHDPHGAAHGPPPGEEPRFLDKPENVRRLLWVLYAICAVLVVAEFIAHPHDYHPWERLPAFYPIYGFLGIVVLVLLAKQLRRVVMRDEEYYDG